MTERRGTPMLFQLSISEKPWGGSFGTAKVFAVCCKMIKYIYGSSQEEENVYVLTA